MTHPHFFSPLNQPACSAPHRIHSLRCFLPWALRFHLQVARSIVGSRPEVVNDTPVVRHNRVEEIVFVLGGLTLAVLSVLYQLWFG
jgi:hypothetical protein